MRPYALELSARPFSLAFRTASGASLLSSSRRRALLAVPRGTVHPALGPREGDGWGGAVIPESVLVPVAAAAVAHEPAPDGSARLLVRAPGVSGLVVRLAARRGERFWGFGERSDQVTRSGGTVENWVGEGPYQLSEYPLVAAITPRWAIRQRRDATYFPIPWLISSAGYGVLIENSELSWFSLPGRRRTWSLGVLSEELRIRLFAASTPAALLECFTAATGRQPFPAAGWFLGPWVQTGHANLVPIETEREVLMKLKSAQAPVSAVETHMRRLPGGEHEGRRADERARTELFHSLDLASLTYLNPFLSEDYETCFNEALATGAFQGRSDGTAYLYPAYIGGREPPLTTEGQLDFEVPAARGILNRIAAEAIEDGHDGWMEDFGEYTPPDAVCGDGVSGARAHNAYPVEYHEAAARAARAATGRPVARFGRSGWTGAAQHLPLVWGGDPTTGWGFDGLASAVKEGLSAGLSGIAFWGSDIGGFFTLSSEELDIELLIRWIQLGAVSPLMRTKAEGIAIPPRRRPQVWDEGVIEHWRRWAGFHTRLSPYLLGAASQYVETGLPLMRHHCLTDPGDPVATKLDDQFMLGDWLLSAPVVQPGARRRTLYLPGGEWVELKSFAIREGGRHVTVSAPLTDIPLFAKAGALLPMLPPDVWSLAVAQPVRSMHLLALPQGSSSVRIGRHGAAYSELEPDRWRLSVEAPGVEEIELDARFLLLSPRPTAVALTARRGHVLEHSYSPVTGRLLASIKGKRPVVEVRLQTKP